MGGLAVVEAIVRRCALSPAHMPAGGLCFFATRNGTACRCGGIMMMVVWQAGNTMQLGGGQAERYESSGRK